jgi:hypothetical protein
MVLLVAEEPEPVIPQIKSVRPMLAHAEVRGKIPLQGLIKISRKQQAGKVIVQAGR